MTPAFSCLALVLTAAEPASAESLRSDVLTMVNAERGKCGAPALAADAVLGKAAQARAEEVAAAAEEDIGAAGISGDEVSRRVAAAGYESAVIGEILLTVTGSAEGRLERLRRQDPETFGRAMDPEYRDLGVGLARREKALVWVLLMGLSARDGFARKTAALADLKKVRKQMLARVNAERKALRLSPLHESALLDQAAQNHAEDMIRRSYYGHTSPESGTVRDRVRKVGYASVSVAENIAEGQSSVAQVAAGWMNSPEHRGHILSLVLTEVGIGVAFGRNDRGWEIVWVQVFGTPPPV